MLSFFFPAASENGDDDFSDTRASRVIMEEPNDKVRERTLDPEALRGTIKGLSTMSSLSLRKTDLNMDMLIKLADGMETAWAGTPGTLLSLDLAENPRLGPEGAVVVASLVARHSIQSLDLGGIGCETRGAISLAEAVTSKQCALHHLNLSQNGIRAEGAVAFARHTGQLTNLDLGSNPIGSVGAIAFAALLKSSAVSAAAQDDTVRTSGLVLVTE